MADKTSTAITKLAVKKQNFTKGGGCLEDWGVFVLEFLGSWGLGVFVLEVFVLETPVKNYKISFVNILR